MAVDRRDHLVAHRVDARFQRRQVDPRDRTVLVHRDGAKAVERAQLSVQQLHGGVGGVDRFAERHRDAIRRFDQRRVGQRIRGDQLRVRQQGSGGREDAGKHGQCHSGPPQRGRR